MPLSRFMGYILKEKLKVLKGALKRWNNEVYGDVDVKIQVLVEEISTVDLKSERGGSRVVGRGS